MNLNLSKVTGLSTVITEHHAKEVCHIIIIIIKQCIVLYVLYVHQGCALRKITRNPKVPHYEIQGAQHKAYMKEIRLHVSGRPKATVSYLRYPGTLRAQPCAY